MTQDVLFNKVFKKYPNVYLVRFQIEEILKHNHLSYNTASISVCCNKLCKYKEFQSKKVNGEKFIVIIKNQKIEKRIKHGCAYIYLKSKKINNTNEIKI